jgi:predicted transcriptional regulator
MPQPNHHVTDKNNFIKAVAADPAGAINSGKLKMQKQEVPFGGIGKAVAEGVAKVVEKVAAKDAAKTAAKVESRALKAANKPTSKDNAAVGPKTAAYVSDIVKNTKPANPNVTRGGSAGSKLNWPESMK